MVSAIETFYCILKLRNMRFSFHVEFARFGIILAECSMEVDIHHPYCVLKKSIRTTAI